MPLYISSKTLFTQIPQDYIFKEIQNNLFTKQQSKCWNNGLFSRKRLVRFIFPPRPKSGIQNPALVSALHICLQGTTSQQCSLKTELNLRLRRLTSKGSLNIIKFLVDISYPSLQIKLKTRLIFLFLASVVPRKYSFNRFKDDVILTSRRSSLVCRPGCQLHCLLKRKFKLSKTLSGTTMSFPVSSLADGREEKDCFSKVTIIE